MSTDPSTIGLITNPTFKPNGFKAYLQAAVKFQINPTKPGPIIPAKQAAKAAKANPNLVEGGKPIKNKKLYYQDKHGRIGDVPAQIILNDLQYLCPVTIGTPGKIYNLNFDTGSSDLWLWSTELPSSTNTAGRHLYDPAKSKTFKATSGSTWAISYNDKSFASGIVGTDMVTVGGLKVKNQPIELANNLSDSFQSNYGDGLFGLAYGTINRVMPVPVPTFAENLIAQKNAPISKQLFTAYLTSYRDADNPYGKSFYTVGHINKRALAEQEINYVDSDSSQGLWQFSSTTATVGDRSISRFDNTAIADTGTSLALVEDSFVDYLYSLIPNAYYDSDAQGYVYPTNTSIDQIPTVKFAVGDIEYEVLKSNLGYAEVGNGFTYGGIQSRGDLSFDVLGDTFLKSVYAIFDIGNSRFGVVPKKIPAANASEPHHHHSHPHSPNQGSKAKTNQYFRSPKLVPRDTSVDSHSLIHGRAPATSDATSFLKTGFSPASGSTFAYGTFILFTYYFSARGSIRVLLAACLCLVLLQ